MARAKSRQNLGEVISPEGGALKILPPACASLREHCTVKMSGWGKVLEEPQIIAEIPRDLTGSFGKTRACDVYAIAGPQKKKLPEVALTIDRQSVDIYNV